MQDLKIICIGDIHFGATPSVFSENSKHSIQGQALTNVANYVLENDCDAVLFAGDILDNDSAYFEASAELDKFLKLINKNNVRAYAVSGNHDANILKRISLKEQNFEVLGQDGLWESRVIHTIKDKKFFLKGKSFTKSHQQESHFVDYLKEEHDNMPSIGLIHAEVGVTNSQYAPASMNEFLNTSENIWVCGHTHAPKYINEASKILIPGSLQALDPTETGIHGAWLIEFSDSHLSKISQIPNAIGYYENVLMPILEKKDFESDITKKLREIGDKYKAIVPYDHNISIRLTISVPYQKLKQFQDIVSDMEDVNCIVFGNITVEKIILKSDYLADLESFIDRDDPLGILANYLTVLKTKQPEDKYKKYIQSTSKEVLEKLNQNSLSLVNAVENDEETIRESMLRGGEILMSKFLKELGLSND